MVRAEHAAKKQKELREAAQEAEAAAQARLRQVLDLTGQMVNMAGDVLTDIPGGTAMREPLLRMALTKLLEAGFEPDDGAFLQAATYAHQRMGEVEAALGRSAEALRQFEASLEVRQRLAALQPEDVIAQRSLGVGHWKVAEAMRAAGRDSEAEAHNAAAWQIHERLAKRGDPPEGIEHYMGAAIRRMAEDAATRGEHETAVAQFRDCLAVFEAYVATSPGNHPSHLGRAMALRGLAVSLLALGRAEEARAACDQAMMALEAAAPLVGRADVSLRFERAQVHMAIADALFAGGSHAPAVDHCRLACALADRLVSDDPVNWELRYLQGRARLELGIVQQSTGARDEGDATVRDAATILAEVSAADPLHVQARRDAERAQRIGSPSAIEGK